VIAMMPIRCFTCGALVAHKEEEYAKLLKAGKTAAQALEKLKVKRYCCRRMFLGNVDIVQDIMGYKRF